MVGVDTDPPANGLLYGSILYLVIAVLSPVSGMMYFKSRPGNKEGNHENAM